IAEFVTDEVDGLLVDDDAAMARALVRLVHEPDLLARLLAHSRAHRPVQDWSNTLGAAQVEYRRAQELVGR
ncbi:MAG TPA: glycosyltransferase family 1 protein, partial [Actinotalea sp.]|nr:glycosyltransferase family 1 protein [Actinotalea sp.]